MREWLKTAMASRAWRRLAATALAALCLLARANESLAQTNPSNLDLTVSFRGIVFITDVTALTGPGSGLIDLSWTSPATNGVTLPTSYDIRVSSTGQIPDIQTFFKTQPLATFSPSVIPAPLAAGATQGMVVSGLIPKVVYYFA